MIYFRVKNQIMASICLGAVKQGCCVCVSLSVFGRVHMGVWQRVDTQRKSEGGQRDLGLCRLAPDTTSNIKQI